MEQITRAQLNSVLTATGRPSPKHLSVEESVEISLLITQMAERYPSQDLEDSLEGYLMDFEQLATRHSLPAVKSALLELRIRPGQRFFPRPDEVAEEIERGREQQAAQIQRKNQLATDAERQRYFWEEVLPLQMETFGETEEQVLARYPSIKPRKAREEAA